MKKKEELQKRHEEELSKKKTELLVQKGNDNLFLSLSERWTPQEIVDYATTLLKGHVLDEIVATSKNRSKIEFLTDQVAEINKTREMLNKKFEARMNSIKDSKPQKT